jgi:hypothetical protein
MEKPPLRLPPETGNDSKRLRSWLWLVGTASLCIILLLVWLPRSDRDSTDRYASTPATEQGKTTTTPAPESVDLKHQPPVPEPRLSAEEIVAGKVSQFARDRFRITQSMAKHFKVNMTKEIESFFEAAEAGRWDDLKAAFDTLKKQRASDEHGKDLGTLWAPMLETFLVAECAYDWPAQKLLDYGESVLGSLRPGMVYVGGTDPGRGIPTLLNETSEGERHIVLTQNALADGSYVQYLGFLYGDKLSLPTSQDSQKVFEDYTVDAEKRLRHDKQFPDEPKQLRLGEDVRMDDGRLLISGQVAVMAINGKLLQTMMDKNPALGFALEESFPLKSTYAAAAPLGPVMELRVQDQQSAFTPATAAQAVDYWSSVAQQFASEPETAQDSASRLTYSKMATAQGNLLADHNYTADAEQAYRLATEICPSSLEAVCGYINLLVGQNRFDEAIPVAETAVKADPANQQFQALLTGLRQKQMAK